MLTISGLPGLTTIDLRALTSTQSRKACDTFREFQHQPMLPANEAYRDTTRKDLDRAVLVEILDVPENVIPALDNFRYLWRSYHPSKTGKARRHETSPDRS